jgi:hypothetical protein
MKRRQTTPLRESTDISDDFPGRRGEEETISLRNGNR